MRRSLPILASVLFLGGLVWLFRVAQRFDPSHAAGESGRGGALGDISIRIENALLVSRTRGVREWSVRADRVDLLRSAGGDLDNMRAAEFTRIHDGVFYRDGKPEARFSASHALYDQPTQRFDVTGGVHVKSAKGDTLDSESLVWSERDDYVRFPRGAKGVFRKNLVSAPNLLFSPKKRKVECPQGASAIFHGNQVNASQLFWDVDQQRVNCLGTVSGVYRYITFTAQGADLDLKTQTTVLNKPVIELRIEGENDLSDDRRIANAATSAGEPPMRPRMNPSSAHLLAGTAALFSLASAQTTPQTDRSPQPPGKTSTAGSPDSKVNRLHIVGDGGQYNDTTGIGWTEKVIATDPDTNTVFHCDRLDFNNKTKTAFAYGNLLVNDPDADVTAEKATIYYARSKKLLVLTGGVHILAKPKKKEGPSAPMPTGPAPVEVKNGEAKVETPPDQAADQKDDEAENPRNYPADITCDRAEYTYAKDKKRGVFTGHLKALQKLPDKTRTLTAGSADWYGVEKKMVLHTPVHLEDTKGMRADPTVDVTVYTEEGDQRVIIPSGGKTTIELPIEDEEDNKNKPAAPPAGKKAPATPPARNGQNPKP